jgi:arginase family enzyme
MRLPKIFEQKPKKGRAKEAEEPEPDEPRMPKTPELPPHDFALLGLRYDKTQTLRRGAGKAPPILRKVFPKLETYIFGVDLTASSLDDLGDVTTSSEKELHQQTAVRLASTKKFPIILGGEHSVSLAAVKALKPDKVVILDAHPDCEASDGHNGVTRKIAEIVGHENVILFGTRVASAAEDAYLRSSGIRVIQDVRDLRRLSGKIYLSVDLDVLDPSIMPSVGNPEPMGLGFAEVSQAIQAVAPNLIGVDFVEFTPIEDSNFTGIHALIAGKLVYSSMAAIVRAKSQK